MVRRISFYNPISYRSASRSIPVSLIGMAHEAGNMGARSMIIDRRYVTEKHADHLLSRFRPNVLGVTTFFHPQALREEKEILDAYRDSAITMVGGPDATARPEEIAEILKPNILVKGEGELVIQALIDADFSPNSINRDMFEIDKIGDTWVIRSKSRYDLNRLPLATELPEINPLHRKFTWQEATIDVARGCIGRCTFCAGANILPTYMSPERVAEQVLAWLNYYRHVKRVDLFSPDLTSNPKKASQIIRALNEHPELAGIALPFFFSVRLDTMSWALNHTFADGKPAEEVWLEFIDRNEVMIEGGLETFSARRISKEHFNKAADPDTHYQNFVRLLETGAKVAADLITFDPKTSLEEVAYDYVLLLKLARKYPNLEVYQDSIFRELLLFPGTEAVDMFGHNYRLDRYQDSRVPVLLSTLKTNRDFFGVKEHMPLAKTLEKIVALIYFVYKKYPKPSMRPAEYQLDDFIEMIFSQQSMLSYHLPRRLDQFEDELKNAV